MDNNQQMAKSRTPGIQYAVMLRFIHFEWDLRGKTKIHGSSVNFKDMAFKIDRKTRQNVLITVVALACL